METPALAIETFQQVIEATYGTRDRERGIPATIAWLTEELGELAQAVRKGTSDEQIHELGDVLGVFGFQRGLRSASSAQLGRPA